MSTPELDRSSLNAAEARVQALVLDAGAQPARARFGRAGSVAALAAYGVVLLLLRALVVDAHPGLQFERDTLESLKLRTYAELEPELDTLFLGTSRMLHHLDAARFDGLMAERGFPTRSFNLGLPGMRHPESAYWAEWVLARRPPKLETLFVELLGELAESEVGPLHQVGTFTGRAIEWHDAPRTRLVAAAAWGMDWPFLERLDALYVHAEHFALRAGNLGVLLGPTRRALGLEPPRRELVEWSGFLPVQANPDSPKIAPAAIEARLAQERTSMRWAPEAEPPPLLADSLARLVAHADAAGVRLVFVLLSPHFQNDLEAYDAEHRHGLPLLFDYRQPSKYPAFYDARLYYNYGHYSVEGAARVTAQLASDFADRLAAEASGG